jgi:lysophospholipase L1-like esterase
MKYLICSFYLLFTIAAFGRHKQADFLTLFKANDPKFIYTGRIDFTDPEKPKFWSPGVYIEARFKGTTCQVLINDEALNGSNHNYIEIVIDGKPSRIQAKQKNNTITIASGLADTEHTLLICKDTESGIGYLEFVGIKCERLLSAPKKPKRKIEYIGDSITAGTGMDLSEIPCDKGQWYDQHNAYMSYGPQTSRALNAQWQLTAVAGIGLVHSCCNMGILMPQVFDKMILRDNKMAWDFKRYQPDVVTICLGQNDGKQDSVKWCSAYVGFIHMVRSRYAKADIVCLTSPMADPVLAAVQKRYLTGIVEAINNEGDKKVNKFFFSRGFNSGCGGHPDLNEHGLIAAELTGYLKQLKGW